MLWEEHFELANSPKHLIKIVVFSKLSYATLTWDSLAGAYMFFHDNFSSIMLIIMIIVLSIFVIAVHQ